MVWSVAEPRELVPGDVCACSGMPLAKSKSNTHRSDRICCLQVAPGQQGASLLTAGRPSVHPETSSACRFGSCTRPPRSYAAWRPQTTSGCARTTSAACASWAPWESPLELGPGPGSLRYVRAKGNMHGVSKHTNDLSSSNRCCLGGPGPGSLRYARGPTGAATGAGKHAAVIELGSAKGCCSEE